MIKISRMAAGVLSAFLLIGGIAGGSAYAGSAVKKNNLIDEQTAEEFAIIDAGVNEEEVHDLSNVLEVDDGEYVYDIRFFVGNTEYEYEIRAEDGSIIDKDVENNDKEVAAAQQQTADQNDQQTAAEKAVEQTAQETAPEAEKTDAAPADTEKNVSDSQPAEQPEQKSENTEKKKSNGYISVDQAKQIALDHAGLTADEVHFSSAKLDNDDGVYEYEIEFYKDSMEYEYDLDAVTGEILEYSSEYDD